MWKVKRLGDICKIVGGGTPSKSKPAYYTGCIPWATVRDLRQRYICETEFHITDDAVSNSSTNIIPSHNVIVATRVGLGKVCQNVCDLAINQDLRGIIPLNSEELDNNYLYWWFLLSAKQIIDAGTGATVQGIKVTFLKDLKIPLPSLWEQKRIVEILDEAFEGIDQAIANTEKNIQNARELFESYLNNIFTNKGDGWEEKTLADVCEKITDGTHQTPKYFSQGFVFLSSKNVKDGIIDWDDIKYIDLEQHKAMQKRLSPRKGDILLRKNGAGYGKGAIVDKDIVFDVYVSLAVLRPLNFITSEFLLFFINSSFAMRQFDKRIKGAGVPNLHLKEIQEVKISFPKELVVQQKIVEKLKLLLFEVKCLERKHQQKKSSLNELKQSLLQKAFSGELTSKQKEVA